MSTRHSKRQLASGISVIAIAATLSIASPAQAQAEYGTLQGHVDGAAAGTQVVAVDTHTGQRSTGTVDAQGNYEILGLRPSTYSVSVAGKPAQTATIGVGQAVSVDFVEARSGAIVVTGRRTAQPAQAQTVVTNITPAQIENLPQNQRNFLSFAALAPGIQLISPSGAQQLQAGALAPQNANILLDGMSFKNPINHGGMLGQNFGDFGNPFPQIAIQEYQLQTQNFGAENGQSASALLSAITKTGGNTFHGSAFIEYQPKSFVSEPYFDKKNHVPKRASSRKQFGGDFGGPIIKDKLSFYVAFEGTNQSRPPATFDNISVVIPENIRQQINNSIPLTFKQRLYFGKLTWFASPNDTVNLMGYRRRQSNLADFGGNAVESHGHFLQTNQDRYQLQWRHSAGDFLNFLNIAHDKATQGTPNVSSGPEYILTGGFDTGARQVYLGANSFQQDDVEKNWTIRDDATLRHGPHTFKAGGQIVFYDLSRIEAANTNGTFFVANPCQQPTLADPNPPPCGNFDITTAAPFAGQINVNPAPGLKAKDTQIGLYVSDEWKPDDHWTVNAGLRWDFESNPNNKNYVTPPAIAAALRAYPGWQARGINPEDFISNGHNRHPFYGEFQPRLGVSYDVHGDRDTVIFGGAGRYYDRNLFIQGVIEQQKNANAVLTVPLPACLTGSPPAYCHDPEALRTYAASLGFTGGDVWVLPNKVKMPYSDQFDLGVRKRFGDINATLTYSHVESHNISMFARSNFYNNGWYTVLLTPTGCSNGGDQYIIDFTPNGPFPNCPATNGQLTGFSGKLNRGINNGRAHLDALFLQVEKPFTDTSTWGFTEAVTIQRARTNTSQELNSDELYNAPEFGAYGWDYVVGIDKWRSVTSGNWRAPFGITLSGILTLASGPAFGHIWDPSWTTPPGVSPVGACCHGDLAGVYFPHKTIGYKRLDLRVAKTFKIGPTEITADFQAFNVFNWLNRTYSSWGAGFANYGQNPPLIENGQVANDQRQFQAGLKFKF